MKHVYRVLLLLAVLGLLGYGMLFEKHAVHSLSGGSVQEFTGPQFVEGTTFDQFGRAGDKLVAPLGPSGTEAKDCKT